MTRTTRLLLIAMITFASAGCDQATKHFARTALPDPGVISLLNDSVRLGVVENHGAFLSLGADLSDATRRFIFTIGGGMMLFAIGLASIFVRDLGPVHITGLALVLGGGIGNLIDRLLHDGAVTDFVQIGLGPLRTGIFNVSDLAIVFGIACFALARDPRPKTVEPD